MYILFVHIQEWEQGSPGVPVLPHKRGFTYHSLVSIRAVLLFLHFSSKERKEKREIKDEGILDFGGSYIRSYI